MNRVLLEKADLDLDGMARLCDGRAGHIRDVLQAEPGGCVRIGRVDGALGTGRVVRMGSDEVVLACAFDEGVPEPPPVDLLLALPRPKVLRRLLPQLAAMGIRRLFLTNAWRVEKDYFSTHVLDPDRLRAALIEGVSQAAVDTRIPGVTVHRHLRRLVEDELAEQVGAADRLIAHPGAVLRLGAWRPRAARGAGAVLAVGPEGGWIEDEVQLLCRHDFLPVALGPRVLRSDTACIALLSVLHERLAAGGAEKGAS